MRDLVHDGNRIDARVGDATCEHRDDHGDVRIENLRDHLHLTDGREGGDVESQPVGREFLESMAPNCSLRVRDGNLDEHVVAP